MAIITSAKKQRIYFIPGTMCDQQLWTELWQYLLKELPDNFELHHVEIPLVEQMQDVIEHIAEQIEGTDNIVVGFSLGGYIASSLALTHSHKFKQLIILSNMPQNLPEQEIKQRKRTIAWIKQRGYGGMPTKRIYDLLHPNIKCLQPDRVAVIEQCIRAMDRSLGEGVLMQQLQVSMNRPKLMPKLAELAMPVLFAVGKQDSLVDVDKLAAEVASMTNTKLVIFPEVGHMLPLESPQQLAIALSEFIN